MSTKYLVVCNDESGNPEFAVPCAEIKDAAVIGAQRENAGKLWLTLILKKGRYVEISETDDDKLMKAMRGYLITATSVRRRA